jgi:hypothetical protein
MSLAHSVVRIVRLLWVVPLSLCSFAFYRVARRVLRASNARLLGGAADDPHHWQVLPRTLLTRRGALPTMMTTGPRLNPHAIIATVGPLEVKGLISLEVTAAARSARSWSIVVYRFPGFVTVGSVGSNDPPAPGPWKDVSLPPGTYSLGLRYYHPADAIELPAVRVDGQDSVPVLTIPEGALSAWDGVRGRRGLFYLCLHYYMFNLLDYRAWLPRAFVAREFLPVGNPQTHFDYGAVRRGQALTLVTSPALLATHDVFFTLYNRHSFPVTWSLITATEHDTGPVPATGFYLVRMHRRSSEPAIFEDAWITVRAS